MLAGATSDFCWEQGGVGFAIFALARCVPRPSRLAESDF